ncbi:glucose-6-phosphate dehydrogenase [Microvirga lotononidis]|uniref:Glucose-6-phosphate 1-dehydrogenase n=1 Tax=Microvirga lotononidis TaxID=864069 RepID=I4YQZ6_9HYPH|nr:glucose-6-phosphate dehydrogenase [Microvirga lotononidis]EIM26388.1 glucose-6-phosphate 1-dehydrogenase [Microvirga lotononidis]WQO30752.1 glucose-6-phosphate dehydrogenase [Microvirga lotononidis]
MYQHLTTLPLPERTPVPVCDLVIAGASGDLAMRKLFPALVQRISEGVIPEASRIVGIVRSGETEDGLKDGAATRLKEQGLKSPDIDSFLQRLSYVRADVSDSATMGDLNARLDDPGRVRAFYLATPPDLFIPAARALKGAGLLEHDSRLILEKPLGRNLSSARAINDAVAEVLPEGRTYRIDHYLGKETVQNLLVLRFANSLFERSWSQRDIDHVQITVAETVGLEKRADYYDRVGALRDMVQNHVLQLLCLFAMEPPNTLDADAVRDEKVRVLRALRPIEGRDVLRYTVRGQYMAGSIAGRPVPGYADELGRDSGTETFTALRCEIDTWRWGGVPIYLRTGKRMGARCSEIAVTFKSVPHSIFRDNPEPNRLVIRVQPDDGVQLQFMMKVPGSGRLKLVPRTLDLRYDTAFGGRTPDAYERLLTDVIRGDQTLFMRRDEVEAAWGFVDPIIEGWNEFYATPHRYAAGSFGPSQAVGMIERDGRSWAEPEVQG